MTQGNSEGIRGVFGRCFTEPQDGAHHGRDLCFFGTPRADDRSLDERWRVLDHRESGAGSHEHGHTPRMTDDERRVRVTVEECLLDGHDRRNVSKDGTLEPFGDGTKPLGKQCVRGGSNHPVTDMDVTAALSVHGAETEAMRARVDAQNDGIAHDERDATDPPRVQHAFQRTARRSVQTPTSWGSGVASTKSMDASSVRSITSSRGTTDGEATSSCVHEGIERRKSGGASLGGLEG